MLIKWKSKAYLPVFMRLITEINTQSVDDAIVAATEVTPETHYRTMRR